MRNEIDFWLYFLIGILVASIIALIIIAWKFPTKPMTEEEKRRAASVQLMNDTIRNTQIVVHNSYFK